MQTSLQAPSKARKVPHSGLRVEGLGFRVQGLEFRALGLEFRVQGSGFGVWGLELASGVEGFRPLGFGVLVVPSFGAKELG